MRGWSAVRRLDRTVAIKHLVHLRLIAQQQGVFGGGPGDGGESGLGGGNRGGDDSEAGCIGEDGGGGGALMKQTTSCVKPYSPGGAWVPGPTPSGSWCQSSHRCSLFTSKAMQSGPLAVHSSSH